MKPARTPGPWYFNEHVDLDKWLACIATAKDDGQGPVYNGTASVVAAFDQDNKPSPEDAAFIVEACNAHDGLVARIATLEEALRHVATRAEAHADEGFSDYPNILSVARAALKAE